jgi:hypothetical protein
MQPNDHGPRRMRRDPGYPVPRKVRPSLFHEDGCVRGNIRVQDYMVLFEPDCPHTKMRGAMMVISAESETSARHYAETFIKLPQQHIKTVALAPTSFRVVPG